MLFFISNKKPLDELGERAHDTLPVGCFEAQLRDAAVDLRNTDLLHCRVPNRLHHGLQ